MTDKALITVYIDPVSSQQFKDIAGYTLSDGSPAVNIVCLFAGNYAASEYPYLRANNDNPHTTQPFNDNIQQVLSDGSIQYLQSKGIKVLLTITNGWHPVGWSEFTSEKDAMDFAQYLKTDVIDKYGLDGIDIDDEYSTGAPNESSLAMVTTFMRQIMPDKMISQPLGDDDSTWQGHTLVENLDYGWTMSYGVSAQDILPGYTTNPLAKNQLSLGFWSGQPSSTPTQDVNWVKSNGYAGLMIFGFEEQANVDLTGQLVNDWYGPGNWNPPTDE